MPGLMPAWLRPSFSVVVCAALLTTGAAQAQQPPADNKAAAKEHYTRGTSFYDLGRYDEAIKEFEAAYELKNDPAFLYNLAQAHRQAGNHERAVHFYKTYLRYVPKPPNKADIEEKIRTEEQLAQKGPGSSGGTTTPPPANTTPPPANTTPPPGNTPPPPGRPEPAVGVPPARTTPPPPRHTPPPGHTPP